MATVREIMSTELVTVEPSASLTDTARVMAAGHAGSALVIEDGTLVGIFTERDIMRALGCPPARTSRGPRRSPGGCLGIPGDGVMFHFPDPGPGVRAALEMVDALGAEGLPPAHVGLAAGPVLFQEGDYFGQTVNLSARIADYARQGEVLVSRAVADASQGEGIAFAEIGDVELKGVSGTVNLLRAAFEPA